MITQDINTYIHKWVSKKINENKDFFNTEISWSAGKEITKWADKEAIKTTVIGLIVEFLINNIDDIEKNTPSELNGNMKSLYPDAYMMAMQSYWDGNGTSYPPNFIEMAKALKTSLDSSNPVDGFDLLLEEWDESGLSVGREEILGHETILKELVSWLSNKSGNESMSGVVKLSEMLFKTRYESLRKLIEDSYSSNSFSIGT